MHQTFVASGRKFSVMRALQAGAAYFALVFGTGFALGVIRTVWIVPRIGIRSAELLEAPFMLAAIWLAAGWIGRRFESGEGSQVAIGFLALVLLLAAEITLGVAFQGRSLLEVFTKHDPVSGFVYYVLLGLFAAMPWLFWKYRKT